MSDAVETPPVAQPAAEELPDPLKGKSPQEVYQMLREEHQRIVGEISAKPAQAATPVQQTAPVQPQQPQYAPPPQPVEPGATIYTDPEKFVGDQFERRMAPIVNTFVQAQRETNKSMLVNQIGKDEYTKYQGEIEQVMNGLDPRLQANPNSYTVAYNYVRAAHLDDIVKERVSKQEAEIEERILQKLGVDRSTLPQETRPAARQSLFGGGAIPQTATPRAVTPPQTGRLSEAERKVARAMDLTDEDYMAYKRMNNDAITQMGRGA